MHSDVESADRHLQSEAAPDALVGYSGSCRLAGRELLVVFEVAS